MISFYLRKKAIFGEKHCHSSIELNLSRWRGLGCGVREPHILSPMEHYCHTEPDAVWVSAWHFQAGWVHRMWPMMGVMG